jgi:CHAT domain-containing protein/Flp pilus assembly protein TadD
MIRREDTAKTQASRRLRFSNCRRLQTVLVCLMLVYSINGLARTQAQEQGLALRYYVEAERLAAQNTAEAQRQAIEKYDAALAIWRKLNDQGGQSRALNGLGAAYYTLGEWPQAVGYFEQALPLVRAAGNRGGEALVLFNLAFCQDSLGDKQRALELYQQVLPMLHEAGNRTDEASTLNNLGQLYATFGDRAKALDHYTRSLRLEREIGVKGGERAVLSNLALLYDASGDKQSALDYYQQSLALSQAAGDERTEIRVLNNLAAVWRSLGETQQAIELSERALTLSRTIGDRDGEAQSLHALGFIYDQNGEDEQALKFYEPALELRNKLGDRSGQASTLGNLAVILGRRGETQRALQMHEQELELCRATGDRSGEAAALNGLGNLYAVTAPQKALELYLSARDIFRSVQDIGGEAAALYRAALVYDALGQLSAARGCMEVVIEFIESQRAALVSQELRTSYFSTKQRYYEYYIRLLMRQHEQDTGKGYDAAALQISERARARSLLELLVANRVDIRQGADPALLARERELRDQLNAKAAAQTRLLGSKKTEAQAAALTSEIAALNAQLQEVETKLRRTSPRYAALAQPQPLTLREIQQQLLDDETLLLEYALGEKQSYLWVVSPSSVSSYALPPRAEIEAAARKVYDLLIARPEKSGPPDAQFITQASTLSRMLLGPAISQLGQKRLLIVAPGILSYLPFAVLPEPSVVRRQLSVATDSELRPTDNGQRTTDNEQSLIADHEIINLPSASVLSVIRGEAAHRKAAARTVAVLADPVFDADDPRLALAAKRNNGNSAAGGTETVAMNAELKRAVRGAKFSRAGFARLPFSAEEADAILSVVAAGTGLKATGFRASRRAALSPDLGQYRIVHFATHGLLNSAQPELSGLVFSLLDEQGRPQDGFLRLHEIFNLKLNADLVVLSACQTGLGREIRGEGLIGLTRGFMYAGAPRVVASLWQVDDLATAELMKRFYRGMLKDGLRPTAALRAAQLEMAKQKRWAAPYFWAAFTLQGEWK